MYHRVMAPLNYHHLLYFWHVVKEGTIAAACEQLHVTQSTVSTQIRDFERSLGEKLFRRSGRNLVPTETGRLVYRYANEIFSLGGELVEAVKGGPVSRSLRFNIGAQDTLPKLIVYRLLEPVFRLGETVHVVCFEGTPAQLLPRLSVHEIDLVLSDAPISPHIRVRAFSHLLGECGIAFFAAPKLARRLRRGFPESLDGASALLPAESAAMRGTLQKWFDSTGVRPRVTAEFEDIELMMAFGRHGRGFFPAHDAIAKEIVDDHHVEIVGAIRERSERFYAISVERRIKHPAVVALTEAARDTLFAGNVR
jgi:LysR family transcriptional regulator, transcriptional activator of nhaA